MDARSAASQGQSVAHCGPPVSWEASGSAMGDDAGCGPSESDANPGIVELDGVGRGRFKAVAAAGAVPDGALRVAAELAAATLSRAGLAWPAVGAGAAAVVVDVCGGGGAIRTGGAAVVSAGRVTVPGREKSRSWAGPTVSADEGVALASAGASCASAGVALPIASATAAKLTRENAFMLTRYAGWGPSRAPRGDSPAFAGLSLRLQAHAG